MSDGYSAAVPKHEKKIKHDKKREKKETRLQTCSYATVICNDQNAALINETRALTCET